MLMHHRGALFQYKLNFAFLALFCGFSAYNYVMNAQVFFGKEWLGKAYLGANFFGLVGLWCFSHRQIRSLYLLKGGKTVAIETYTNFGLTYNRHKELPVSCFEGNRIFGSKAMNLY